MQFLILNVDTNDWVQIHFSLFTLKLLPTVSQKKKKKNYCYQLRAPPVTFQ